MKVSIEREDDDPRQHAFAHMLRERLAGRLDDHYPDVVVVVGGDGAMLRAIRRRLPAPDAPWAPCAFLGIGRGTVNFLMNPESLADRLTDLDPTSLARFSVHPILVSVLREGEAETPIGWASNDAVFGSGVMDWHSFTLNSPDGAFEDYHFRGMGLCCATPIGSTAFNANNGGAVLPLDLPIWSLTGVVANRDLNEIFSGDEIAVTYSSRTNIHLHLDGQDAGSLGREGVVFFRRRPGCSFDILFEDRSEFARKRIDLLKAKRK